MLSKSLKDQNSGLPLGPGLGGDSISDEEPESAWVSCSTRFNVFSTGGGPRRPVIAVGLRPPLLDMVCLDVAEPVDVTLRLPCSPKPLLSEDASPCSLTWTTMGDFCGELKGTSLQDPIWELLELAILDEYCDTSGEKILMMSAIWSSKRFIFIPRFSISSFSSSLISMRLDKRWLSELAALTELLPSLLSLLPISSSLCSLRRIPLSVLSAFRRGIFFNGPHLVSGTSLVLSCLFTGASGIFTDLTLPIAAKGGGVWCSGTLLKACESPFSMSFASPLGFLIADAGGFLSGTSLSFRNLLSIFLTGWSAGIGGSFFRFSASSCSLLTSATFRKMSCRCKQLREHIWSDNHFINSFEHWFIII